MATRQFQYKLREKYVGLLMKDGAKQTNFLWKLDQDIRKRGRSPIILVVGEPRSGKTELCIGWSWLIKGDNFVLDRDIYTSVDKLLDAVEQEDIWGRSIILDEAQKDLDIGAWNNKLGRALVQYNGSQAIRKNILWIIMPYARWLPWIQHPAINYVVEVYGNGWADYIKLSKKARDFKGKIYETFLESFKMPRIPKELIREKDKWEIPEKKKILSRINLDRKGIKRRSEKKSINKERLEYLEKLRTQNIAKGYIGASKQKSVNK